MKKQFKQVAEFNQTYGVHEAKSVSALPSPADSQQSAALLREEVREYEEAMRDSDLVGVADALGDITVVVFGAFRRHGISDEKAIKIFNEIHRSNMSKTCNTREQADYEVLRIFEEKGETVSITEINGKFVLKRLDGKIMKPSTYTPPNLRPILELPNEKLLCEKI